MHDNHFRKPNWTSDVDLLACSIYYARLAFMKQIGVINQSNLAYDAYEHINKLVDMLNDDKSSDVLKRELLELWHNTIENLKLEAIYDPLKITSLSSFAVRDDHYNPSTLIQQSYGKNTIVSKSEEEEEEFDDELDDELDEEFDDEEEEENEDEDEDE